MTQVPATTGSNGEVAALYDPQIEQVLARVRATGRYGSGTVFLMQALNAATLEEATDIGSVIAAKEHLNERIRFIDVQFMDSDPDLDSPIPIFAVCTVAREMAGGEIEKLSCGAAHVVGVLIRAAEQGWFPFDAELVSVDLGKGMKAINLQLAPQQVESSSDF